MREIFLIRYITICQVVLILPVVAIDKNHAQEEGNMTMGNASLSTNIPAQQGETGSVTAEPDLAMASSWWTDLRNKWTPVGWKNHAFRFNVLYDGTILVDPKRHLNFIPDYAGVQLTFAPVTNDMRPHKQLRGLSPGVDDNRIIQGWTPNTAPVLWSEWVVEGLIFKQEIFAHIPGAGDVETGVEPIFSWVRLSISGACQGLPLADKAGFAVKVNAPCLITTMSPGPNMRYVAEDSKYPAELIADQQYETETGFRLIEDDGRIRLGLGSGQKCEVEFRPQKPREKDSTLVMLMDAFTGNHIDMLIPLVPVERDEFEKELSIGFDRALTEANRYWSKRSDTAANFEVPEEPINDLIRRNLQMTQIIAEKSPATGEYSLLTGSLIYSQGVWATPGSIAFNFLDLLGYHNAVKDYLEIFKNQQGTVVPPGPSYTAHPGFLSTPKTLTSVDWLTDHGALLWAITGHALITGDTQFTEEWLPGILKACEFIRDARRITGHAGAPGILPPAAASDWKTLNQSVWSDGWTYKGLVSAVKLLKKINHPRAEEFASEARDYGQTFVTLFREKTRTMPTWTDSTGQVHHLVPAAISGQDDWEIRSVDLLDTGALCLIFAGLMEPEDELMKSALLWFREGPPVALYRPDSDWDNIASLRHEMASSEPCYSWNLFASWKTGDRMRFLEGMYSLFAGAYSRQTYTVCETRHGITGCTHWMPSVLMARLAVIDDQIAEGELHLLRLLPLAWLKDEKAARFENMPTEFGPVSLKIQLGGERDRLDISFQPKYRERPNSVILHIPPLSGLQTVYLNDKSLDWDQKSKELKIN